MQLPESITTEQQSLVLVKKLLAISVSCITYMRGLFPESSYGTRYLDGNACTLCSVLLSTPYILAVICLMCYLLAVHMCESTLGGSWLQILKSSQVWVQTELLVESMEDNLKLLASLLVFLLV